MNRPLAWLASIALSMTLLAACAHKAPLRSPSQIAVAEKKAAEKELRDAARAKKRAAQQAERREQREKDELTSQEVTVPAGTD